MRSAEVAGRPTRSACADYKTLNKITLELHRSVRPDGRVDVRDGERRRRRRQGSATGKGRRRGRNVLATRCRHVAEERDGACLFKPILYRIFILMDFFNSVVGEDERVGPGLEEERVLRFRSLALENVQRVPDVPRMTKPVDYHTCVSITVRISRLGRWAKAGETRGIKKLSRFPNSQSNFSLSR